MYTVRLAAFCVALALLALSAVAPTPAAAKTCKSHKNQASAQKAKDTRDADKDGIYCESLPCPCSKAKPKKKPKKKSTPRAVAAAKPYTKCGRVPAFVSAAINVRQKNTSCRRARQIADLWQRNAACSDGTCRLFGFACSSESVESERYSMEARITCKSSGARVKYTEVVP